MATKMFKATYGKRVEFTVRPKDEGSMSDGGTLWSFEYCEGNSDDETSPHRDDDGSVIWERGLPALSGKQLAAFALWLVSSDPPGIASPHHETMSFYGD
jgi:hypothetical protein